MTFNITALVYLRLLLSADPGLFLFSLTSRLLKGLVELASADN
jgi:hypothetical protein